MNKILGISAFYHDSAAMLAMKLLLQLKRKDLQEKT